MDNFSIFNKRNGQIMIETLVAISIAVIGILGIFSLTSRSLSLNNTVSDRYIGSNLAMEGIEVVKNMVDHNVIQRTQDPSVNFDKGINDGIYQIVYSDTSLGASVGSPDTDCDSNYARQNQNIKNLTIDENSGFYSYSFPKDTGFRRIICVKKLLIDGQPDELKINSLVAWTGRDGVKSEINLEDYFFNW